MTTAEVSPAAIRLQPGMLVLLLLVGVFAVTAGYGWLGESRDYSNYISVYDSLGRHESFSDYRFERGYMFASWLAKFYLGMDFAQYYASLVAVSLFLKFRLLWKHASAPIIAALVYLMVLFPLHEYTQLRAAVAFAFAYTAVDEYLEGRWLTALLLFVVGVLFHTTAVVIGAGAISVLLVARRSPVVAASFFAVIAVASSLMVSTSIHVLKAINPLASAYINKAFLAQPPTLLSGENILLFGLMVSSAIFLRPWQARRDGFYYYLSFWIFIAYFALFDIPVFAHRVAEAFIFSCFLYAFRFDTTHRSRLPSLALILTGGWMLYEAVAEGLLFVASR